MNSYVTWIKPENLGIAAALATAFVWSTSVILFKQSGAHLSAYQLNIFKNTIASVCLFFTLVLGALITPEHRLEIFQLTSFDWIALSISGIVGIAVADTLFFQCLKILGAARTAIVETSYSPSVLFWSALILHEEMNLYKIVGAALVLLSVILISLPSKKDFKTWKLSKASLSPSDTKRAAFLGVFSMILIGVAIVSVKPILERVDAIGATFVRVGAGTFAMFLPGLLSKHQRSNLLVCFKPHKSWKSLIPASLLGTYIALIFWVTGFKYAPAGVAAVLNQSSTVLTTLMAVIWLNESFGLLRAVSMIFAIIGCVIVAF